MAAIDCLFLVTHPGLNMWARFWCSLFSPIRKSLFLGMYMCVNEVTPYKYFTLEVKTSVFTHITAKCKDTRRVSMREDFLVLKNLNSGELLRLALMARDEGSLILNAFTCFLTNHKRSRWEKVQWTGYQWEISCMMSECTWQLDSNMQHYELTWDY